MVAPRWRPKVLSKSNLCISWSTMIVGVLNQYLKKFSQNKWGSFKTHLILYVNNSFTVNIGNKGLSYIKQ